MLLNSTGTNNALRIEANDRGAAFNGYTVNFIGGGTAGSETVPFNSGTLTYTVQIARRCKHGHASRDRH